MNNQWNQKKKHLETSIGRIKTLEKFVDYNSQAMNDVIVATLVQTNEGLKTCFGEDNRYQELTRIWLEGLVLCIKIDVSSIAL